MQLSEYQQQASTTMAYPLVGSNLVYPALGLAGETGEVVEHIKKAYRKTGDTWCHGIDRDALGAELGDVLWYVAAIATEAGLDLSEIAGRNLAKLRGRAEAGTLTAAIRGGAS